MTAVTKYISPLDKRQRRDHMSIVPEFFHLREKDLGVSKTTFEAVSQTFRFDEIIGVPQHFWRRTFLADSVKCVACSGQSGSLQKENKATTTVRIPSKMKIHLQPA